MSVTSNDKYRYLKVDYQISSPKIELVILQFSADNRSVPGDAKNYSDQLRSGGWSSLNFLLASDVARIQLVAKKIGVTTNVEYVLVGIVEAIESHDTGNMPLMYCRSTAFVVGKTSSRCTCSIVVKRDIICGILSI